MADSIAESNETFRFLLTSAVDSNGNSVTITDSETTGTIINDDLGEISNANGIAGKGEVVLNWTNPTSNLFSGVVTIAYSIGGAAPSSCSSGTTTDVMKESHTITGLDNGTAYSFRICAKSNAGTYSPGVVLLNRTPFSVDGFGNGRLSITDAEAAENSGTMRFTIQSTATSDNVVTITYDTTVDNPTKSFSADASEFPVVFDATASLDFSMVADTTVTFSVAIPGDATVEANETFSVILKQAVDSDNNSVVIDNFNSEAVGTILNDDTAIFTWTAPDATNEGGNNSSKQIPFILSSTSDIASYVELQANPEFIGGGAKIGSDFTVNSSISLNSANNFKNNFAVIINGDNLSEANETINISANFNTFFLQAGVMATIDNNPATTRILNDDIATISTNVVYNGVVIDATTTERIIVGSTPITRIIGVVTIDEEGESFLFRISSSNPIDRDATIAYNVIKGVTKLLEDFNIVGITDLCPADNTKICSSTSLAAGTTAVDIPVLTINDTAIEADEMFTIGLNSASSDIPMDVTITERPVRVTIIDNDMIQATVSADATSITEGQTVRISSILKPAMFERILETRLTLSAASGSTFNAAADITVIAPGRLRIYHNPGAEKRAVTVRAINNEIAELDRKFIVTITSPDSAVNDMNDNSTVDVIILDDDIGEIRNAGATIGNESVTLSWTNPPNSSIFKGVDIAYNTGQTPAMGCSGASDTTVDVEKKNIHTIDNLTNGDSYYFRICSRYQMIDATSFSHSTGDTLTNVIPNIPRKIDVDEDGLIDISDATQLYNIRYNLAGTSYRTKPSVGNSSGCPNNVCRGYELTANIDLSSFTNWNPIGSSSNKFTAILEGNNKTISNLTIDRDSSDNIGLFSAIQDASIGNLELATVDIAGGGNVGALVGNAIGTNTLSNIELIGDESQSSSDAEIKGNGANVGGLVGNFAGTISDASSSLTVRGGADNNANNTGGLVGLLQINSSIKNSNSSGSVSASNGANYVGGLVGENHGAISNSWASGNVSGIGNFYYGGLVGWNRVSIINSWASGNVSGNEGIGGLVGVSTSSSLKSISNSWASGNVSGNSIIGGLVGQQGSGSITQSWTSGKVTGDSQVGGLVGFNGGQIQRRNYRFSSEGNNIGILLDNATTDLARLSGASGTATTDSNWHAGIGTTGTPDNLLSRFCDTDGSGSIETSNRNGHNEQVATNSVWVMGPPANDNVTTEPQGGTSYYQIPAIRCIANTKGITDQTKIDEMRKIEIDRQRRLFPDNR